MKMLRKQEIVLGLIIIASFIFGYELGSINSNMNLFDIVKHLIRF